MTCKRTFAVVFIAGTIVMPALVSAQQRRPVTPVTRRLIAPKAVIEIGGGYRPSSETITDTTSPTINLEPASFSSRYEIPSATSFNGGVNVRLWKSFGVGIGVNRTSSDVNAAVSGSIPHPFSFSHSRQIAGDAGGLSRDEFLIGVTARAFLPLSRSTVLTVGAGPAWTNLSQDVVTEVSYSESYPYDTATYRSSTVVRAKQSKLGFTAAADLSYFFSRRVGVGAGFQFVGVKTDLPTFAGNNITSKVGGLDIGGGLRIRF